MQPRRNKVRNALSIAGCIVAFAGALSAQIPSYNTPAGRALDTPGLTPPVLKQFDIPPGLSTRLPNRMPATVDVAVTIKKDGTIKVLGVVQNLDPRPGGWDDQAAEIVKRWKIEPGLLKGKAVDVSATLSVDFGNGLKDVNIWKDPPPRDFAPDAYTPLGPGVVPPVPRLKGAVTFPQAAITNRQSGTVVVAYVVKADGHVGETRVIQSVHPRFVDPFVESAVRQWFFEPGLLDGKPVPVRLMAMVTFSLK